MKIWDTWLYNGEIEALHARLAVPGVFKRVIVESYLTHSGHRKEALYYQWQLPDVILITPDLSQYSTCWERENAQRNAIMQGLTDAQPEDIIMLSDADEQASPDGITRAIKALTDHPAVVLEQTMFNYSRRWYDQRGWRGTIVTTYKHLLSTSPQALRNKREELHRIPNAGEHTSWFGGVDEIVRKLRSYAHDEYKQLADHPELIKSRIASGQDLFGRWSLMEAT